MANQQHPHQASRISFVLRRLALAGVLTGSLLGAGAKVLANVQFENCVTAADGSITCDTRPKGQVWVETYGVGYN
jgi:hypothetical protein